jgi:mannosylglycerate hydrolase MGH1-like protein
MRVPDSCDLEAKEEALLLSQPKGHNHAAELPQATMKTEIHCMIRMRYSIRLSQALRLHLCAACLLLVEMLFSSSYLAAQEVATPANLPESGLALRTIAQPLGFFDATGRKAGVFGKQTGQFEAWIYPIKLLHGFRLEFQPEGQLEPIRGETLLQQIITRPESTTLVYVHPSFTVREAIWTPLDEPAVVIFFEVDATKPLDITVGFVPDFKPMWPASFGGRHSYWIPEQKAFALTNGTEHPTALIGSSAVSGYTEFADHQLGAGEMLLRVHATSDHAQLTLPPLAMVLSMESEAKARAVYQDILHRARSLFEQRVQYHRQFLTRTLSLETPDPSLNADFTWAKVALDSGWVCHPDYGCGLVAGYGPSGAGERPGFAWWFGGDALMSSWALEDYGDLEGARQALRFLKARQRADGKMLHELTQSAALIDWFGKYGYAYYHADTTPMYLYSLGQYWRRTGDRKFLDEFWDSAKKAYAYCVSTISPEDGLMDNTKAGLAAVEVGVLRGKVVKDIYLEGFWVGALESMSQMAASMEDKSLAKDATLRGAKARESLGKNWWDPERHGFDFGMTADGHRAGMLGVWPSVLLAVSEQMDSQQAALGAEVFAQPELATDWGVRWLTNQSPLYDPLSYNNGSAWPFINGIAAWAEYRQGLPLAGFSLWNSLANLTSLSSPGMLPELMNGDRYLPGEHAVPHQLFSSVGVVLPAVRGLLGLESDVFGKAPDAGLQVTFSPNLPADWPFLRFRQFAIGEGHLSGEILQQSGQTTLHLQYEGNSPLRMMLAPSLPALSHVKAVRLDGKPQKFSVREFGSFLRVEIAPVTLPRSQQLTLSIDFEGGIGIVPVTPRPEPGERTSSLKVLNVQSSRQDSACLLRLTLAGIGGRTYSFRTITPFLNLKASGLQLHKTETGYEIDVPFAGSGYVARQACMGN